MSMTWLYFSDLFPLTSTIRGNFLAPTSLLPVMYALGGFKDLVILSLHQGGLLPLLVGPFAKALALPFAKALALPFAKALALPFAKALALPFAKALALPFAKAFGLAFCQGFGMLPLLAVLFEAKGMFKACI